MVKVKLSPGFRTLFKKRANERIRRLFRQKLAVFKKNPHDPSLNDHALKHEWEGYRSWSLTDDTSGDDFRVIYKQAKQGRCLFAEFGTHDQLYRTWKKRNMYSAKRA